MSVSIRLRSTAAFILLASTIGTAAAQTTAADAASDEQQTSLADDRGADTGAHLDEIVVTGRLGNAAQKKVEASYSITTLKDTDLRARAIDNLANALQTVPGIWADDSGGVTANNVRVRGIPRGGYESLAVYEDGLPIQHDPGINWINVDQFLRIDETYASIEAVRGGPSSIFAANAPGGLINFMPRKGTPELSGLVKLTTSDYGQARGDVWVGGPIGDGWRFSAGGFYNWDQGVRDPGPVANNGGQGRVIISKNFARGSLSLGVKYLEDNNFFFDAVPLVRTADGSIEAVPGIDGNYDTLTGEEDGLVTIKTPGGIRDADFNLFNQSSDLQFTIKGDVDFGGGTTLNAGFRYRDSQTNRNARGLNSLSTQAAFLATSPASTALRTFAPRGATALRYVYATDGSAFPADANGNGYLGVNTFQSIQNPISEMIGLVELGQQFETGFGSHDLKIGIYGTAADWSHDRNDGVGLTEVAHNARLVDLVAVNAAGQVVGRVTDLGISRYNSRYANSQGGYEDLAIYIADEWQVTPELRVDAGFRYESIWMHGVSEGARSFNLGDADTLADDNAFGGSGTWSVFDEQFDDQSYTVGVNWQFVPNAGVFARYTNTYRLPQIGQYRDNVLPADVRSQSIVQAEGGVKFQTGFGGLFATVFYNEFQDVQFTNTFIDPVSLLIRQETNYGDVQTIGLELEGNLRPVPFFEVAGTLTYQEPEFQNYTYNTIVNTDTDNNPATPPVPTEVSTTFDGNRPSSMPKWLVSVRPQLRLMDDRIRILGEWRYEGDKFNNDSNTVRLPAFSVFNASAQFDMTDQVTVSVKGSNLTNELGLGQGGGQQQLPSTTDGDIILARPIFGRAVTGSVLFRF